MKWFSMMILVVAVGLIGCDSEGGGDEAASDASAPLVGEWIVENKNGEETGQTVTITPDHITMVNPKLKDTEGKATLEKKDDKTIVGEWMGVDVTFDIISEDKVEMKNSMGTWTLLRNK